ncbi:MAG: hypothetical protein ACP5O3_00985 [Candidatus Micrarchaeia archaeon]
MAYNVVLGLAAFLLALALLFAVYFFFRAFKESSLARALLIVDAGLLAVCFHAAIELLNGVGVTDFAEAPFIEILAYVIILIGLFVARKDFQSFDWLKEITRG